MRPHCAAVEFDAMKDELYLLRPGFFNVGVGPLYCGDSLPVEGLLSFFPQLRTLLEVHYLEFPRPRAALVKALGDANQGIPVLILAQERKIADEDLTPKEANGRRFFADERSIRRYLSAQYTLPEAG
jgi:Protein of unknown function (DUF3088)